MARQSAIDDPAAFKRQIRMAALQVAGLKPSELEAALAYEIEPLSGIPAAEADIAFREVANDDPTVRVYDVAVRRRSTKGAADGSRWLKPLIVLGVLVVLLVAADATWTNLTLSRLNKEVSQRERLDAQVKAVERSAREKRNAARAIREGREAAEKAQNDVARMRSAWPSLMKAVADSFGNLAIVREIVSTGPFSLKLSATAASAEDASKTMVSLSSAAANCGWKFHPGTTVASGSGCTVIFECELSHD